jgi:hypothetical protein
LLIMTRVLINVCSIEELMSLPGIGAKGVDKILELREAKGDLELEDLNQVPYLRLTPQLINCLDFTSFEDKEGLGSLYDRHRERVRSVDQLVEKWEGTGPGHAKGRGKDRGQFDRVPSAGEKSYHSKQEGDWWQQSQSPERFEDSELDATFIERLTPGGYKSKSAPGQSKSPSVRRTRRDDFELESSSDERDRAYMHNLHIRDSDIRAGFAFPRGPGLPHSEVLASKRGKETQDYRGEMSVPNIRAVAPSHRENVWQERGGRYSPPRNTGGGWSREHTNPLMRESRGRTRHTLGREHETPRNIQRREKYEGERERGQSRPSGEDPEGPRGRNPYTPRSQGSGNRPRYTPRR